ncbi:acyltransferase domain-containing protein, partial [Herbidospora mongoliensis]|uniref:acyltransferase domain-containing protein n=1 Tax=Herbidospora mongoliensis TaxID=688067 RepID=UPI0012FAF580
DLGEVVMVFPGQGAQWVGMATRLLDTSSVFAARIAECAAALEPYVDWSLVEVLRDPDERSLERVDVVQPVLWAVMVSLAALWRSFGVEPAAVVGHSQGEIAAAVVAGALTLGDGAKVVALRSQLIARRLAGQGMMLSVALPADQVEERSKAWAGRLSVAVVNGLTATVVAGEVAAVQEFQAACAADGVRVRPVPVDYASHSPQVEQIEAELLRVLEGIAPRAGEVPFFSTVTGDWLDTAEMDAGYWYRNLRRPVQFAHAVGTLAAKGFGYFVECSAHPVLTMAIGEVAENAAVTGTLRRDEGGMDRVLASLAELHVQGMPVDWAQAFEGTDARWTDLPTYPFQRSHYWSADTAGPVDVSGLGLTGAGHPLLAGVVEVAGSDSVVLTGRVALDTHPWLADHAVLGSVLIPGTALVELALRAGRQVGRPRIEDLTLEAPLLVPDSGGVHLQVVVGGSEETGLRTVEVFSRPDADEETAWQRHASGSLTRDQHEESEALRAWPPAGASEVPIGDVYERLLDDGYGYGPVFQGLRRVWRDRDGIYAEVALTEDEQASAESFAVHPALLDAALHAALPAATDGDRRLLLPFSWSGVRVFQTGATRLRVRLAQAGTDTVSLLVADATGAPVAAADALAFRPLSRDALRTGGADLLKPIWTKPSTLPRTAEITDWTVLDGFGELPHTVTAVTQAALRRLQAWLDEDHPAGSPMVVVTRRAVGVGDEELPGLSESGVWGLVRSAQAENPGRFVLVDSDEDLPEGLLARLVASGEPQLAVRAGEVFVPRLVRSAPQVGVSPAWDR